MEEKFSLLRNFQNLLYEENIDYHKIIEFEPILISKLGRDIIAKEIEICFFLRYLEMNNSQILYELMTKYKEDIGNFGCFIDSISQSVIFSTNLENNTSSSQLLIFEPNRSDPSYQKNMELINSGTNIHIKCIDPLANTLIHDDLDSLKVLSTKENFDFNTLIKYKDYRFDCTKISAISFSVLFGAMKCFKYLLLNGSNPDIPTDYVPFMRPCIWDTLSFAAFKGNIEAIQIFEQIGKIINCFTLSAAAMGHKNEVLEWLLSTHQFLPKDINYALSMAAKYNNFEAVDICLQKGAEIDNELI